MNAWLEPAKQQEGKTCVQRLRDLEALGVSAVAVPSGQPKSLEPPPPPGNATTGQAEQSRHLRQPPGSVDLPAGGDGGGRGWRGARITSAAATWLDLPAWGQAARQGRPLHRQLRRRDERRRALQPLLASVLVRGGHPLPTLAKIQPTRRTSPAACVQPGGKPGNQHFSIHPRKVKCWEELTECRNKCTVITTCNTAKN